MIYFIQATSGGLVKIGRAGNPRDRLFQIQSFCPIPLRIIGTMSGGVEVERSLHDRFKGLRHHGEWFSPDPMLLEFIERSVTPWADGGGNPCVRKVNKTTGLTSPTTMINCTVQYREWIYALSNSIGLPLSSVVGSALSRVAEAIDFDPPPFQGRPRLRNGDVKPGTFFVFSGTPEWRGWLNRMANSRGLTISATVKSALRDFAVAEGFDRVPPEK